MGTKLQSAGDVTRGSSAAPLLGPQPAVVRDGGILLSDLIDRYALAYTGRDTSRSHRLRFWQAKIGHLRLDEVTDDHIFHAVEELAQNRGRYYAGIDADGRPIFRKKKTTYSPATLNRFVTCASAVFAWAIRQRVAPREFENPCRRVPLRTENNAVVRFLSDDERERLLVACRASKWPMLYCAVLFSLVTGCRKGELQRLRWADINLVEGIAHLEVTKNGDQRTLVLTPTLVEELRGRVGAAGCLVFKSQRRPDKPYNFDASVWPTALRAARITKFRWHDLRHSCASMMAMSGCSLVEIGDTLGHRSLAMSRRYSHLAVSHRRKVTDRVFGDVR
jgi:integrase